MFGYERQMPLSIKVFSISPISQPTGPIAVPGSDVAIIATPPSNLNITRFGVTIDLAKVFAEPN
jgi:hypothetical protein